AISRLWFWGRPWLFPGIGIICRHAGANCRSGSPPSFSRACHWAYYRRNYVHGLYGLYRTCQRIMLTAILTLSTLAVFCGLLLRYASIHFKVEDDPMVDQIDSLLPQTQCGQCGYPGCRPYAQAIAADETDINHCPPGGETTIAALADLLGREPKPL